MKAYPYYIIFAPDGLDDLLDESVSVSDHCGHSTHTCGYTSGPVKGRCCLGQTQSGNFLVFSYL